MLHQDTHAANMIVVHVGYQDLADVERIKAELTYPFQQEIDLRLHRRIDQYEPVIGGKEIGPHPVVSDIIGTLGDREWISRHLPGALAALAKAFVRIGR